MTQRESIKAALLLCPFCGGRAIFDNEMCSIVGKEKVRFIITCKNCGIGTYKSRSEDVAIREWNTRADKDGLRELLDALKDAVGWADHVDWSNGNTDPTGSIDEGNVRASKAIERWKAAIAKYDTQERKK